MNIEQRVVFIACSCKVLMDSKSEVIDIISCCALHKRVCEAYVGSSHATRPIPFERPDIVLRSPLHSSSEKSTYLEIVGSRIISVEHGGREDNHAMSSRITVTY